MVSPQSNWDNMDRQPQKLIKLIWTTIPAPILIYISFLFFSENLKTFPFSTGRWQSPPKIFSILDITPLNNRILLDVFRIFHHDNSDFIQIHYFFSSFHPLRRNSVSPVTFMRFQIIQLRLFTSSLSFHPSHR